RRERALLFCVLLSAWEEAWGQLRYSVPEEMPKGSFVGDVTKDLGLQMTAVIESRMQYFSLHGKTGQLVTAERIDREQLCEDEQQCVLRCELIVEGEMKVYEISVEITDINDNAPSFREGEKELRMSEAAVPGSRFPLVEARDPDMGTNSLQSYELSGDEHFSLVVQDGPGGDQRPELVLAKALDREEAAFHDLVLKASDGGKPPRTGTARIRVVVLDTNDNAPVFSQAEYTVRVPEDVPLGSTLVIVTATDPDEGLNGHVKYSLKKITEKASKIFQLNVETGAITINRSLDFEQGNSYELEVQADDGGGLSHTAQVAISVTDVNDNAPQISVRSSLSDISEDTPSGTVVALLHDADVGSNSLQDYKLEANKYFEVEVKEKQDGSKFAELVLRRTLDREREQSLQLVLTALDSGDPPLSGTAQLCINVTDANDNAPVFAQDRYRVSLREDSPPGSMVLNVSATDADAGTNARITYGFGETPTKVLQKFVLDSESGIMTLQEALDFEQTRSYTLLVEARDGGSLVTHCEVEVEVLDVNDNAPEI
ncbi:PCDG9 protein, partial [Indicator maculatus]|nr:PCDG9 protein [Indicator maculatus]